MPVQPCPWCGNKHIAIKTDWLRGVWIAWAECSNCHVSAPAAFVQDAGVNTKEEAEKRALGKWNLRIGIQG